MYELMDSLAKSSDSAVGPDDIHYQVLKHCKDVTTPIHILALHM